MAFQIDIKADRMLPLVISKRPSFLARYLAHKPVVHYNPEVLCVKWLLRDNGLLELTEAFVYFGGWSVAAVLYLL